MLRHGTRNMEQPFKSWGKYHQGGIKNTKIGGVL